MFFKVAAKADNIANLKIEAINSQGSQIISGSTWEDNKDGTYTVKLNGAYPTLYNDPYTVTLYNGNNAIHGVKLSINTYFYANRNEINNVKLGDLIRAAYRFGASARKYVDKYGGICPNFESDEFYLGNQNTVGLGALFEEVKNAPVFAKEIEVTTELIKGTVELLDYEKSETNWAENSLKFKGTGSIKLIIHYSPFDSVETIINVVDAVNVGEFAGKVDGSTPTLSANENAVLLNDIDQTELNVIKTTLYGNGFSVSGLQSVNVDGGTLKNVAINCSKSTEVNPAVVLNTAQLSDVKIESNENTSISLSGSSLSNVDIEKANSISVSGECVIPENTIPADVQIEVEPGAVIKESSAEEEPVYEAPDLNWDALKGITGITYYADEKTVSFNEDTNFNFALIYPVREGIKATHTQNVDVSTPGEYTVTYTITETVNIRTYVTKYEVTVIVIEVIPTFALKFENTDKYVGNMNTVALGSLFSATGKVRADKVNVDVAGNASGTFTATTTNDWEVGTVEFTGTGVVSVTLKYGEKIMENLKLEVVAAVNVGEFAGEVDGSTPTLSEDKNVVLLNDIENQTALNVKDTTLYGNGFSVSGLKSVNVDNGTLKDVTINCSESTEDNPTVVLNTASLEGATISNVKEISVSGKCNIPDIDNALPENVIIDMAKDAAIVTDNQETYTAPELIWTGVPKSDIRKVDDVNSIVFKSGGNYVDFDLSVMFPTDSDENKIFFDNSETAAESDKMISSLSASAGNHRINFRLIDTLQNGKQVRFTKTVDAIIIPSFTTKFVNCDKYLYRVGNANAIALGSLFALPDSVNIDKFSDKVGIKIVSVSENVSGTFVSNTSNWANGTILFDGSGIVKVTISYDGIDVFTLPLEVINASNATVATGSTSGNIVLLNDVTSSGSITVGGGYTLYGNGFKMTFTGSGSQGAAGTSNFAASYLTLKNGNLEGVQVICPDFGVSCGMITADKPTQTNGLYPCMMPAVNASGDSSISNSYIYGARVNVFSTSGNITLDNTVLSCGATANMQLWSSSAYTVTLKDVTTIQYNRNGVYGLAIINGSDQGDSNAKINIQGKFNQYNWVCADDANSVSSQYLKEGIIAAVSETSYQHDYNSKKYVNLGIIYFNTYNMDITDSSNSGYGEGSVAVKYSGVTTINGQVYSVLSGNGTVAFKDDKYAYESDNNGYYRPSMNFSLVDTDEDMTIVDDTVKILLNSGESREVDFGASFKAEKYGTITPVISCVSQSGNAMTVTDGKVSFNAPGKYYVTYSVNDNQIFDKDGNDTSDAKVYFKTITVHVTIQNSNLKTAELTFNQSTQKFYYYVSSEWGKDNYQYIPLLNGLKIIDYDIKNQPYTVFDGDNDNQESKIVRVEHTNTNATSTTTFYFNDGGSLEMYYSACANSGKGATAATSIKVDNSGRVYAVSTEDTTAADDAFYWQIYHYKYTGNNGKTVIVNGNTSVTTSTAGLDLSKAVDKASGRTKENTSRNSIMQFDANGNPANGIVFTGASTTPTLWKNKTSTDASGYYCYTYGKRATAQSLSASEFASTSYKIALKGNADDAILDKEYILTKGAVTTSGSATRVGFTFGGWYTKAIGGEKVGEQTIDGATSTWSLSYSVTGDVILYAHWLKPITIKYDTQGGEDISPVSTKSSLAITLPTLERKGYNFKGWYDAAGDGEGNGALMVAAGGTTYYVPENNVTLYAHWEKTGTSYEVTLKYNDTKTADKSLTYEGDALDLGTPTYGGSGGANAATLDGWYDEDGNKVPDPYSPSKDTTLTAKWTPKEYKFTYTGHSGVRIWIERTFSVFGDKKTIATEASSVTAFTIYYGDTLSVKYKGGYKSGEDTLKVSAKEQGKTDIYSGTSEKTETIKVTGDIKRYAKTESSGCFASGTLITLANGSQKPIEDVTYNDKLLVWDFFTGEYTEKDISILVYHGDANYQVVNSEYSDGTVLRTIADHGVFDYDLNRYVYLTAENCTEYIGHRFVKYNANGGYDLVTMTNAYVTEEYTGAYSITSSEASNVFAETLLTVAPPDDFYNWIEMDGKLHYNVEKFYADIEKYGTYDYDVFKDYVTYEQYVAFNGAYLKSAVERGKFTFDYILQLIEEYSQFMPK